MNLTLSWPWRLEDPNQPKGLFFSLWPLWPYFGRNPPPYGRVLFNDRPWNLFICFNNFFSCSCSLSKISLLQHQCKYNKVFGSLTPNEWNELKFNPIISDSSIFFLSLFVLIFVYYFQSDQISLYFKHILLLLIMVDLKQWKVCWKLRMRWIYISWKEILNELIEQIGTKCIIWRIRIYLSLFKLRRKKNENKCLSIKKLIIIPNSTNLKFKTLMLSVNPY